jgi:hypothetical protein
MSELDDLTPEEQAQLEKDLKENAILPDIQAAQEAREKYIKEEMAKGSTEKDALEEYLNNFTMYLPYPEDTMPGMGASYRRINRLIKKENVPYGEFVTNENERKPMSPLKLSQTPLEFEATIDQMLIKHGIDLELVRELNGQQGKKFEVKHLVFRHLMN